MNFIGSCPVCCFIKPISFVWWRLAGSTPTTFTLESQISPRRISTRRCPSRCSCSRVASWSTRCAPVCTTRLSTTPCRWANPLLHWVTSCWICSKPAVSNQQTHEDPNPLIMLLCTFATIWLPVSTFRFYPPSDHFRHMTASLCFFLSSVWSRSGCRWACTSCTWWTGWAWSAGSSFWSWGWKTMPRTGNTPCTGSSISSTSVRRDTSRSSAQLGIIPPGGFWSIHSGWPKTTAVL